MESSRKPNATLLAAAALAVFLFFFYFKYVPMVPGFQVLVLAVGLALFMLGAAWPETGTLVFLCAFLLLNFWPYVFGIDLRVPHAPMALVLFLFFALGRLVRLSLRQARSGATGAHLPLRGPMLFFAALTAVSALLTLWRFSGLFPFAAGRLYEYSVNVSGVSAGGARMSALFLASNFLTGMAFFALVLPLLRDARFRRKALAVLAAAILVASAAGLAQKFIDPRFGNTAFWVTLGQLNGTFKDPNAFAAVLSLVLPLLAAAFLHERGSRKLLFGIAAALSLGVFPFIGSRSALLGLAVGIMWVALSAGLAWRKAGGKLRGKSAVAAGSAVIALAAFGVVAAGGSRLFQRLTGTASSISKHGLVILSPERYFLWKEALSMTKAFPVSGVGVGAYIVELPNFYSADRDAYREGFVEQRRNDSAENLPLQVTAELGLIGLAAFVFLLVAIVKTIRGALGPGGETSGPGPPDRILFVGAAAGVLSFGIGMLFHSYVGSFEVDYVFWFLAAFLASVYPPGAALPAGKRRNLAMAAAVLVIFAAVHAWSVGHSLSPGSRWDKYPIPREFGLYRAEKTADGREFRWTRAYGAFSIPGNAGRVSVQVHAAHPDIASRPVDVEFLLIDGFFRAKIRLGDVRLTDDGWKTVEYDFPEPAAREAFLLVRVSRTWVPLKATGIPDPRTLGVAVGNPVFSGK